jgi:hypothetical protein
MTLRLLGFGLLTLLMVSLATTMQSDELRAHDAVSSTSVGAAWPATGQVQVLGGSHRIYYIDSNGYPVPSNRYSTPPNYQGGYYINSSGNAERTDKSPNPKPANRDFYINSNGTVSPAPSGQGN